MQVYSLKISKVVLLVALILIIGISFLSIAPKNSIASNHIPCLDGAGPLLPGQSYCPKGSLDPGCDPSISPGKPGGCGFNAFIGLINKIIKWLVVIGFPLGGIFIAYGGIVVLTSTGSKDKLDRGKSIITGTVLALVIAGVAFLIVKGIITIIGATNI